MKLRTKRNLIAAMQCGALDAAKYHRFAACACMDGEWDLAKVFHNAADSDRTQHFSKEAAEREGVEEYSPDNLRNSIHAEMKELNMFTEFAHEAMEDGDANAAALFNRVSRDKAESCRRFQVMLEEMVCKAGFGMSSGENHYEPFAISHAFGWARS